VRQMKRAARGPFGCGRVELGRRRCWSWLLMRSRIPRQRRDLPSRRTAGGGRRKDGHGSRISRSDNSRGKTRVNLNRTCTIQRLRETQGWTVFHLPSTRTVYETPSAPGSARTVRRPASSTTSRAALCLKSAWRSCCCDWASPKLCTSPPRGGAAAAAPQRRAPPRRGHARRAVCLPRRGCSPPSLFNRAGFDAKVAYRVVVAPAPVQRGVEHPVAHARWPMAGIARCNDWARICRGSRVSTDPGLPSSSEQPFVLSSASITPARFVSFSELLPISNTSMRWVQTTEKPRNGPHDDCLTRIRRSREARILLCLHTAVNTFGSPFQRICASALWSGHC